MSVITIPKPLRDKLGDEAAESFAMLLKEVEFEGRKDALVIAEERFERRLSEEVAKINQRITDEVARLDSKINQRITEEIARLDKRITEETAGLRVEIAKTKSEIIKWMFIFWASQIGAVAALFALLR
jgi:bifunctional DNA-binding transcriptional regulator/antitoxin component of YhaV-PrlF toxin-antitoxin module